LVITVIILLILAGITIATLMGDNGLLNKADKAKEQNRKQTSIEIMKLKITNIQMQSYDENGKVATLQYLADKLCEDVEIQYVSLNSHPTEEKKESVIVEEGKSIYTKLKEYPYEFEINSSLQLKIDGSDNVSSSDGNMTDLTISNSDLLHLYNNIITKMNDANSIELLLNDTILLPAVLSINDNIDYIINNPSSFLEPILKNENAVKALANNEYAKSKIKQNEIWLSELKKCEYAYVEWTQPIVTKNITTVEEGTITVDGSVGSGGSPACLALDGKKSNGEGGYWWPNMTPAWWQVEFPYEIRIKSIDYYNQYSTAAHNLIITARLYVDSTKKVPIGDEFSSNAAWQRVSISGIKENEIITNTIYFYKTTGNAGIGELVINADKFIF